MTTDEVQSTVETKVDLPIEVHEEYIASAEDKVFVDPRAPNIKTVFSIIRIIGVDWILIFLGIVAAIGQGLTSIFFFLGLGRLFNGLQSADGAAVQDVINQVSLTLTYVAIAAGVASFLANLFFNFASQRISVRLKQTYFDAVTAQEIGYFDIKKTGELINALSDDVNRVVEAFGSTLMNFSMFSGQIVGGFILGMIQVYQMVLLGLCSLPITLFVNIIGTKLLDYFTKRISRELATSVATANEVISSIKTVRSMAGEEKEKKRYERELRIVRRTGIFQALSQGLTIGTSSFFTWGALTLGYWWAGQKIQAGTMSGGDFVSGDGYIFMTVMGVEEAIKLVPVIIKAHASAIIILNTIKREPAMNIIGGLHPEKVTGNISFENVTFRYPSRPKVTVLNDLNLNIEAGKSTALVGSSGCGKSTIIALVERWYDPESGSVKLDGVDLRDIDQQWLHRYVGIVSQEPTLFATTIRKNITYAADNINAGITRKMKKEGKTQDEIDQALIRTDSDAIEQAAKAANAHQFIMKLDKGYDTMVGERGASLSGGQKQRVAIARAVLQNPQILLLDEATSALDTKSESLVQDALNKLMHGRTSIVIAHRLSTIQDCDQIVVFKEGKVVEMGKHDQLIQNEGGVYYNLAQKQMKYNQKNRELTVALNESDTSSQASDELTSDVEETVTNPTIETPLTEEPDDKKKKKKKKSKKEKEMKDEELPDPHAPKVTALSMIPLIGVDWIPFILMAISSVVAGAIPILFILMYSYIVNAFTPARNSDGGAIPFPPGYNIADRVSVYCSYLAIICAGAAISQFGANFFASVTSERLRTTLKTKYFNALISQEMGLFDIKKTGKLLNQLSEDVQAVQEGLSQKASLFIQHVTTCIIGLVLAFTAAWRISLLMLGTGLGIVILAGLLTGPLASWLQKLISARSDSASATATEVIGSMRTVRSMGGEPRERKRLADDLSWISRIGIPNSIVLAFAVGFVNLGIWGDSALAFWFGGTMISKGELGAGQLMQTFINILLAVMGLGFAATQLPSMFKALGSSVRLLQVIKRKSTIPLSGGTKPERVIGNVTFENIVFEYPSRPGVTVLKDFSLTINQGTAVALVGESGSGKSTIVGLLERFYDPKEGRVLLDGVDLKEIDPIWLHKNIAIVSQEPVLFATTIQRNIAYAVGDENVTMDQIIEAAKTANCHDFITKLPDGYQTLIGERGVSLSGGQKQRIAIARAMLQNASILLLDEATSALDTEAEHIVQQAIEKLMVGRTSIVIAHRLSTVANSDKIIVMGAGQVLEMGTHDELLAMNGEYRKLAMKQMQFGGTK